MLSLKYWNYIKEALKLSYNENIVDVIITSKPSLTSDLYNIEVQIESDCNVLNKKLFLKTSNKSHYNPYHDLCIKELEFYDLISDCKQINIFPKCYINSHNIENDTTILILEDLGDSYFSLDKNNLSEEYILQSCKTLALFHAHFWNIENVGEKFKKTNDVKSYLNQSKVYFQKFLDDNLEFLSKEVIQAITISYQIFDEMVMNEFMRYKTVENITVINGDSHIFNFMFPKMEGETPKLIDYQFWRIGIGCYDLAHLTRKLHDFVATYEEHQKITKVYYNTLVQNGIDNYTYAQCFDDYKKCVAALVLNPVWQYSKFNIPFDICIQPMESLINNFKMLYKISPYNIK